jgi:hypothetical protein
MKCWQCLVQQPSIFSFTQGDEGVVCGQWEKMEVSEGAPSCRSELLASAELAAHKPDLEWSFI